MKGKMTFVESSHIGERVMSHKSVPAPAIFPFDESVVVAFVIKSPSIDVWLATNTCFAVTKQHRFVTKPKDSATNQHSFLTKNLASSKNHLKTSTFKQKEDASWPKNTSEFF